MAAISAHFALAGQLAAASLSLQLAATHLDDEGASLCAELAELLPADDDDQVTPSSDREFVLDRARTHREKAELFARNGCALADAMVRSLRQESGVPDGWERRDELCRSLRPYAVAIDRAAAEAERALGALDRSFSQRGVREPAAQMAAVVRFLNLEAALFSAVIDDDGGTP